VAVDAQEIVETVEVDAPTPTRPDATAGLPAGGDALAMMRDALLETTPTETPDEPTELGEVEAPKGEPEQAKTQPGSRRAKTVERVLTDAEQKIADAEARAAAAEAKAAELEAKVTEVTEAPSAEQARLASEKLQADYSAWIGTPDQYAEAQRLSRMDPDDEAWDFEKHKAAVNNLETWDGRRKWAGILTPNAEAVGEARAFEKIRGDFVDTLAADLPESARATYTKHPDGIPGAVRFYAETIYAPKLAEKDDIIAERDAEIERLRTAGGGSRSPAPGGGNGAGGIRIDYDAMTPAEMMAHELAEQARQAGRRR
jgi:hypothetical protein